MEQGLEAVHRGTHLARKKKKKAFSEEVTFEEVILETNRVLKIYHPRQESDPWTLRRQAHLKALTFRRV